MQKVINWNTFYIVYGHECYDYCTSSRGHRSTVDWMRFYAGRIPTLKADATQ